MQSHSPVVNGLPDVQLLEMMPLGETLLFSQRNADITVNRNVFMHC